MTMMPRMVLLPIDWALWRMAIARTNLFICQQWFSLVFHLVELGEARRCQAGKPA